MKSRLSIIKIGLFSLLAITSLGVSLISPTKAEAASGFQADRIIDDSVFFNSYSMDANSIQAFLNSKVPSCDTNGTQMRGNVTRAQYGTSQGNPPPYTCLRDYTQSIPTTAADSFCGGFGGGTYSAAQIIHIVSRVCGINPQSLIVLLQKEQGLVTDDWPWQRQYRSATGYGCPDTAACDSKYYGFFNQVYNAARQTQRYVKQPGSFNYAIGRNSYVAYQANAPSCGGTYLTPQTQATAALYNYTPYQPNAAALAAGYGSAPPCGAYGNRNFWLYFNDWFGPTIGPLVRTPTSGELFYSDGNNRYRVGSMNMVQQYGLGLNDVRIIPQSEMDALPLASSPNTPDLSYIVKSNSDGDSDGGNIYIVDGGRRYLVTSMDLFADYGFSINQIGYMPLSQIGRMPVVGNLSSFARNRDNGYVYKLDDGKKRGVLDLDSYTQLNPGGQVTELGSYVLGPIPVGTALVSGDAVLHAGNGSLWLVTSAGWYYIPSMESYNCLGLGSLRNLGFNDYQSTFGTQVGSTDCRVQTSGNQRFLMDYNRRIPVDSNWGLSNYFTPPDSVITRLPSYSPTSQPVFRTGNNGALYVLESGKKRQIYTMSSFYQAGHTMNDIFTANSDFLSTIATGPIKLADGSIIRDVSNGALYVIASNGKYSIPNMHIFNSYGYDVNSILNLDPSQFSSYSTTGTLQRQLSYTPGATVFDSGIALQVDSSLHAAFGFNGSQPTYPAAVASSGSVRQATRYLKFGSSGMLYYMDGGTKRPVYSWDTFVSLGGSNNNITGLSASAADLWPTGSSM